MFRFNTLYGKVKILAVLLVVLALAFTVTPTIVFAAGQPNQSCQVTTVTPGRAALAPGSAFNPTGTAGMVYAGQQPQNSKNPMSVSQYDVACYQNTIH